MEQRYGFPGKGALLLIAAAGLLVLALLVFKNEAGAQAKTLYWGSRGSEVVQVQQKLKAWGYYKGSVDGVYGASTRNAVVQFQTKNGLPSDGVVGSGTWAALGISAGGGQAGAAAPGGANAAPVGVSRGVTNRDSVNLLARVIEGEAANEPFNGKVAVGAVIMNRMKSSSFPGSLSGVVYQPLAFESVSNGQYTRPVSQDSLRAAQLAVSGHDPTGGALFFWNPYKKVSAWIWSRPIITQIGQHVFAR